MARDGNQEAERNVILEDLDVIEIEKENLRKNLSLLDLLRPSRNADITLWQRLFGFARPYVSKIILSIILTLFASAMLAPKIWCIKEGIQPIIDPKAAAAKAAEDPGMLMAAKDKILDVLGLSGVEELAPGEDIDKELAKERLICLIFFFFFIVVAEQILKYFQSVLVRAVGSKIVMDIRNALFGKVMSFSLRFHTKNHSAKLMSRITSDIQLFGNFFTNTAVLLIQDIGYFIICVITLAMLGGADIFIYVGIICLTFIPVQAIARQIRRRDKRIRQSVSIIYSQLSESLSGQKIVKAFGSEEREYDKFRVIGRKTYRDTMKSARLRSRTAPVVEIMGGAAVALFMWYGGIKVINGVWKSNDFLAIAMALLYLIATIRRLARCNNNIQGALAGADRVAALLYSDPEIVDERDAVLVKDFQRKIRFKNIGYEYEKNAPVLKNIDFTVRKGQKVALVGPSGAGKTTLVDLIPRFYDVVTGAIMIDDVDIRNLNIKSLRKQIGIVSQETFLFSDTVRMNIAYASPHATEEMIVNAAKTANAHAFIMGMENGYDTQIGERGVLLSGGQRQRIAIARAVLKNPPILILDEATSALDSKSEVRVQEALSRLMKGRTVFAIAHRLSTVREADMILVFDEARMIEKGSHEELMARNGLYARLYEYQSTKPADGKNRADRKPLPRS